MRPRAGSFSNFAAFLFILTVNAASLLAQDHGSSKNAVSVLYAGSLTAVMEKRIGPAFSAATHESYQGEGQGSTGAAHMIHDRLRQPDVFISADPLVNTSILMGSANGEMVTWFTTFAGAELVIGYNPKSRFAAELETARAGKRPWYEVLALPGFHMGRTDPDIDPKGYRTLFLFGLAAEYYHKPALPMLLGDSHNPAQIFPEPELLARLEAGQLDAAIFYRHEVLAHQMPFIELPDELNQGNPRLAALYAKQTYRAPKGTVLMCTPILFTVTIPSTARNVPGAIEFIRFLLGDEGKKILSKSGFRSVTPLYGGDAARIPAGIGPLIQGNYLP
jgi:molybdate/tungstate transport system substrate-binding protein